MNVTSNDKRSEEETLSIIPCFAGIPEKLLNTSSTITTNSFYFLLVSAFTIIALAFGFFFVKNENQELEYTTFFKCPKKTQNLKNLKVEERNEVMMELTFIFFFKKKVLK